MMTSDSENDFRYSSTSRAFLTTAHASPCPEGELRCVSGICISVSQLCDKVSDQIEKHRLIVEIMFLQHLFGDWAENVAQLTNAAC